MRIGRGVSEEPGWWVWCSGNAILRRGAIRFGHLLTEQYTRFRCAVLALLTRVWHQPPRTPASYRRAAAVPLQPVQGMSTMRGQRSVIAARDLAHA